MRRIPLQSREPGAGRRKDDPRSRRSHEALINAAAQLLAERDPDEISITDIAQQAGLSRPTVYQHFADKESALTAVLRKHIGELLHGDENLPRVPTVPDEAVDRINTLVTDFSENRDLYRRLFGSTAGAQVRTEIHRYLYGLASAYVRSVVTSRPREQEELARFITGGAIALLEHWSRSAEVDSSSERRRISRRIWTLMNQACSA